MGMCRGELAEYLNIGSVEARFGVVAETDEGFFLNGKSSALGFGEAPASIDGSSRKRAADELP